MILDVARTQYSPGIDESKVHLQNLIEKEEFYPRWVEHPSSCIIHHERECCEEARLWFLAYARSMEGWAASQHRMKPPSWLSQHFKWGPSVWPITWCQVFKEKTIDCGVFAALAREVFTAQGFRAHPAQALLSYNENCTEHWKDLWENGMKKVSKRKVGEVFPWVGRNIVYHELCLLEMPDGKAKIYDSTFGNWFEPAKRTGFGALLSVRSECPRILRWGDKLLSCGEWVDL
jgi:hypothetical protein